MKQGLTELVLVADRSGSMRALLSETVNGLNKLLDDQREEAGECRVTFVRFDTQYEVVFENRDIKDLAPLTAQDIDPRGMTALLDAQGRTIVNVGGRLANTPEDQRPERVIFATVTDGLENASQEFTREKVKELIEHQKNEYSWHFMFLGANQDAVFVAQRMGICKNAAMTYAPTGSGCAVTYDAISRSVSDLRSGASYSVNFTDKERATALS